jgi:hypothetical protein
MRLINQLLALHGVAQSSKCRQLSHYDKAVDGWTGPKSLFNFLIARWYFELKQGKN